MTKTALVTGASGFIGRRLAARLVDEEWRVLAVQRSSSADSALCDGLRDSGVEVLPFGSPAEVEALAREASADVAFHLATHYLKDHRPEDIPLLIDANVSFGTHLLEGLRGSDTVVVSAMSYFQYRAGKPTPYSLYSATKQAFFEVTEYYRQRIGLDLRQIVLYDTFGPKDDRDKLVPHLLRALSSHSHLDLGPSRQPINLLYVDDVVSGLLAAAERAESPVMTLRASEDSTVGEVVRLLGDIAGVEPDCSFHDERAINDAVLEAGEWPTPPTWPGSRPLSEGLELTWRLSKAS